MEQKSLLELTGEFRENINELKDLLKLPEKYSKDAKFAKKEIDRIFLPIAIRIAEKDLINPPKGVKKSKIKDYLSKVIDEYREIEPGNIDDNGKLLIDVNEDSLSEFKKIKKHRKKLQSSMSYKIHIEKAVIFNLISYLEQVLSDISRIVLKEYPKILKLNEKSINYSELSKFENIEDIEEYLITQEIEKLLFNSLSLFLKFFEDTLFNTKLPNLKEFQKYIIEIKERRNLLIHNSGIVNSRYLNTVDSDLQIKYKIKKDQKLSLGKKYLEDCILKIEIIGLEVLFFSCIKFLKDEEREESIWFMNNVIYENLNSTKDGYILAEKLSMFLLEKCEKYLKDEQKDYIKFNYWYILKKQGRGESIKAAMLKYDPSSKSSLIRLCYYSLTEDYKKACKCITPALNDEEKFSLDAYLEFPILEGLKKDGEAKKIIKRYKETLRLKT